MPFYRIKKLGENLGIPLPTSTQWDVVREAAEKLEAIWAELVCQAAQGKLLHSDDTRMKILALQEQLQQAVKTGQSSRKGVFTTGIISKVENNQIVLFFTGQKHAGENLESLLEQRKQELEPPIQMSDGSASNTSGEFESILANCLVHGRRNFVDVVNNFPEEVKHVLAELGKVYKFDAETKKQEMTPEGRLAYHQEHSKPVMDALKEWFQKQFEDRLVEPNSSLGRAIRYMLKRWEPLTLFLRVAGAPLDNNAVERALKKVVLHRKNALFFKTPNGARVGDIFMSLLHTAELAGELGFRYLTELLRHPKEIKESPGEWMPWNYRDTMARLAQPP